MRILSRRDVLELLSFIVNLVPAEPHRLHEEQLDQPVPAEDESRKLLACRRERHPRVGLVFDEP